MTVAVAPFELETDAAAIARSLDDGKAFGVVFDRHWPALHAYCTSRAGSPGEDLAAETFRIAFADRHRFDDRFDDARPWLYGIATNLLRHHFRSAERKRGAMQRLLGRAQTHEGDDVLGRVEAARLGPRLTEALQALRVEEREALLLLAWTDLGYEEIAEALQIPVGTVRSRIHRARGHVQTSLTERNRDD